MALTELMIPEGSAIYYDSTFRAVLEDHLSYLRALSSTTQMMISPGEAYRFEYALFDLLNKYGVQMHLHWLVMRVNNFTSPEEFTRDVSMLLVPDQDMVDRIRQSHQTTRRIS